MLLKVYMLIFSTEVGMLEAAVALLALIVIVMGIVLFTHMRNTKKRLDTLMSKISSLYVRQTQAATVRHDSQSSGRSREEASEGMPPIYHHPGLPRSIKPTFGDTEDRPQEPELPAATIPEQPARIQTPVLNPRPVPAEAAVQPEPAPRQAVAEEPLFPLKAKTSDDALVESLKALIEKNLSNPDLSVNDLAAELCVSRSGLFAKIKEATGETPNKMINDARLDKATKLLEEGKKPINEICYLVGYSSPSYFTRCFFKKYGMTPHEWMKNKGRQ